MKQAIASRRVAALAAVLALAGAPSPAAGQRSHAADVTAVVVEVPVQVVAQDGSPVRGLTADDFELLEGRRRRQITGFEVVDLATAENQEAPSGGPPAVPLPARRHFLLLFDLSFSQPAKLAKARHAAREVVAERMHPSDLVAVATYGSVTGVRWLLGFTSDRAQVDAAIQDLGLNELSHVELDPLGLIRVAGPGSDGANFSLGGRSGRELADGELADVLERFAEDVERSQRGALRARAEQMMLSLRDVGDRLRWVQGRKHVVLLSQGFPSSVLAGTDDQGRIREMNEAAMRGEYWRVDSDERFGSSAALSVLDLLLDELRRADAAVHSVDLTGITADPLKIMARPEGEDSLFAMADGTGGELYRNFNDLAQAMTQLLDRTSVTYVLSFQPEDLRLDGGFHPIRVRLKGGPAGARVVHRPGYYAPLPFAKQSLEARQITAAQLLLGGEIGGPIPVAALATPMPGAGELAHVPLLLEIDGPAILEGARRGGKAVLDLYAYAFDREGEVRDFVAQQMAFDLGLVEPALRRRGIKFQGQLELPPGPYTTRILVRDLVSGRSTVQEASFVVPPFATAQQPVLLPPLVPDGPPEWLVVGEPPSAAGAASAAAGFRLDGREFLPAARATVATGGATELVLLAWRAAAAGRRLEARVLDAAGVELAAATLERLATREGPQGLEQIEARLRAPSLPPGSYTLEVRLVDPAGGAALASSIPLILEPPRP